MDYQKLKSFLLIKWDRLSKIKKEEMAIALEALRRKNGIRKLIIQCKIDQIMKRSSKNLKDYKHLKKLQKVAAFFVVLLRVKF